MTEKDILELEKDNFTTIHLHLVGIFWRAYQRSALGFCKEIRAYKINVRSNKRQRTVVSFLGFPDSALQEILAINECVRLDDSHITLPMQYLSDEEVAETLPAYNDLPEKVRAVVTPSLSSQIMAFPLHSSTPLECMEFANFYLAPFDHYCKHTLGLRYYGRYVDDFFVVHSDPDCLKSLIPQFKEFLSNELKARLHPNKVISWDRVRHKAWLSARRECYSRLWALRRKYPDKKFSFEELYKDICMERYLKRMGGI